MLAVNAHEAVSGGAEMFCVSGGRGLAGALAVFVVWVGMQRVTSYSVWRSISGAILVNNTTNIRSENGEGLRSRVDVDRELRVASSLRFHNFVFDI